MGLLSDTGRSREAGEAGEARVVPGFGVATGPGTVGFAPRTVARCGPELISPEGAEAQTCVMTEGRDIWARSSYRNATGGELRSVLTQMGPGGRTVEVRCTVDAQDEPAVCETPRRSSHGGPDAYTAVAEYAGEGAVEAAAEEAPLLLRAGSNPASPAAG
ncbi:hypothetical protein [Streptomyces sp. NPDC048496]|uniref:hypothetical protein n=1 Tax=Streptomyces sp. NPDC048496 TaxID=3365558 RepID=UPI0037170836